MIRPVTAYFLASFILLSQVGLPMHLHYCKGILESVSVFFSPGCNEHDLAEALPVCCANGPLTGCSKDGGDCCDDRVEVLSQEITSLLPHIEKWSGPLLSGLAFHFPLALQAIQPSGAPVAEAVSDTGPPRYILYRALIYYA